MKLDDLLNKYEKESQEYQYFYVMLRLIKKCDFEQTKETAIGLMRFLNEADIVTEEINTITFPVGSSIRDIAELASFVFTKVNPDPDWWYLAYQEHVVSDALREEEKHWLSRFRKLPEVTKIIC